MSNPPPPPGSPGGIQPLSSVRQDMRNLSENSGATLAELETFLGQLRGKSPAEMLGVVAQSRLVGSTLLATLLVAGGIALFTVLPFVLNKVKPEVKTPVASATAPAPEATPSGAGEPSNSGAKTVAASTDDTTGKPAAKPEDPPPADDLLDTLGIGETKTAPLSVNPLDGGNDDLFNELE